ncbi:hypothetical protein AK812_SmicGene13832 [Symbiodinium microadriaticum]|uniref:ISXO2-like transposase domain-containing protein n=1 Tax=Symbiodinium microadriaticum TaxID=2951 RepID=A0A1Q9E747_SYMMI|nr:hypothetical protein AK812_SmicGene13832 [Symbiodinium microadriaticum]
MAEQEQEFLTVEEASRVLWPSARQSLWLMVWWGLLVLPHCCANGHEWQNFNRNQDRGNYFLHCTTRETVVSQRSDDDENSESPSTKKKMCNRKLTWRRPGTVPIYCCRTMAPDTYLRCLYWFCDDFSYNTARKQARATPKMWSKLVHRLRSILLLAMCRLQDSQGKLGGLGNLVAIDETWMTTKKRVRGGFRGRQTAGTKTSVLGMVEVNLASRRSTGRCLLLEIPDRKAKTLQTRVRNHVLPGSLVSLMLTLDTDGLPRKTPATCTGVKKETSTFSLSFYAVFEIGKMRILTMLMIQLCPESCLILQLLPESTVMWRLFAFGRVSVREWAKAF